MCLYPHYPSHIQESKYVINQRVLNSSSNCIPPFQLIKSNSNRWAPVLTSPFLYINLTDKIPEEWKVKIIVCLYKKGNRNDTVNYRPISLLYIINKLLNRYRNSPTQYLGYRWRNKQQQVSGFRIRTMHNATSFSW